MRVCIVDDLAQEMPGGPFEGFDTVRLPGIRRSEIASVAGPQLHDHAADQHEAADEGHPRCEPLALGGREDAEREGHDPHHSRSVDQGTRAVVVCRVRLVSLFHG